MRFKKYLAADKPNIFDFYRIVSNDTDTMAAFGRWMYGVYPTDKLISEYIENGQMYCLRDERNIYGAVALTNQTDSYHDIRWSLDLRDEDVLVVHLLAIHPKYQRKGIAKKVMQEVIALAVKEKKKAIRLDALSSNFPAHRLYEAMGFVKCDVRHWYAENTGWTDFFLFELLI